MNNKPAASITEGQPTPEGLGWINLWIEEEEDLTPCPVAQAVAEASDASAFSPLGAVARNVWIEEEEDLAVRSLPASTLMQDGSTLHEVDASTVMQDGSTQPVPEKAFVVDCTTNPFAVIQHLLVQAHRGEEGLTVLRGCQLVRELGRGGMGAVALIQRSPTPQTPELLALKIILPQVAANPKAKARFLREIETNQALVHPHIVPLRDWGCWRDVYFFTSDYCDGGDVEQFTRQHGGKLPPEQALPMIFQTLEALDYAHRAGVVHRDVKPSNVFLCGSGASQVARLGDFGLARAFATAELSGITGPGALGGTLQFMPQQLLDDFRMATPEVDVWSAAASLYYLLTGQPPRDFSNEPPKRWLWVVSNTRPVPIRQRDATIPPALADVLDQALDDKDTLPFRSAAALSQALESAL